MKASHVFERPRWRPARKLPRRRSGLRQAPELGNGALDLASQLRRAAVKLRFECCKTRLGTIESMLRRVRGRDGDFSQIRGLLDQLFDRSFVNLPKRIP